jgi:hypothetical protein
MATFELDPGRAISPRSDVSLERIQDVDDPAGRGPKSWRAPTLGLPRRF